MITEEELRRYCERAWGELQDLNNDEAAYALCYLTSYLYHDIDNVDVRLIEIVRFVVFLADNCDIPLSRLWVALSCEPTDRLQGTPIPKRK